MLANYGYSDGSGDYFLTIDTDSCDGCGECVPVCPANVLEIAADDYGKMVARVREEVIKKLGYMCPGAKACQASIDNNCQRICKLQAISLTW